jgi:2-polyprenyl-3-methyl-5-hydroxy-6-metoxy-1,4-benzoquinol methylase
MATTQPEQPDSDQVTTEAFAERVLGDTSACLVTLLAALGDRLGLFKALAMHGPATSVELAVRASVNERYAREWLGGMAAARYVEYDPASGRFTLPPEYVPSLAQEGGPFFVGGHYQTLLASIAQIGRVAAAFRTGGGVPQSAYDDSLWEGQARLSARWVRNLLTQVWLPALPQVQAKLERGSAVADIGCGRGAALIKLAQGYPNSYYVGYDLFEPAIVCASENARAAGVADRVRFQQLDAAHGLPAQYDVVTTFDVVHDAADPCGLLRAIRQALKPDGSYVCVEMNCSDKVEENAGPIGALFHGVSILYCMTTSLAQGGAGLGTLGLPEAKLRALCIEAGFRSVERLPLENPFNVLYEVKP